MAPPPTQHEPREPRVHNPLVTPARCTPRQFAGIATSQHVDTLGEYEKAEQRRSASQSAAHAAASRTWPATGERPCTATEAGTANGASAASGRSDQTHGGGDAAERMWCPSP